MSYITRFEALGLLSDDLNAVEYVEKTPLGVNCYLRRSRVFKDRFILVVKAKEGMVIYVTRPCPKKVASFVQRFNFQIEDGV